MKRAPFLLAVTLALLPQTVQASVFRGLGVTETLRGEPILAPALDAARLTPLHVPVFVRVQLTRQEIEPTPGQLDLSPLEARMRLYGGRGIPVVLALSGFPVKPEDAESWRLLLRGLVQRRWAKAYEFALPGPVEARPDPKDLAYLLKLSAVAVRGEDKDALVIAGDLTLGDLPWLERLFGEDVAAYLDGVAVTAASAPAGASDLAPLAGLLEREDASAEILISGHETPGEPAMAAQGVLERQLADLAGKLTTIHSVSPASLPRVLAAAASIKDVLTSEVVTLDEKTAGLKLTLDGQEVTDRIRHRLLYNATSFATYLIYQGEAVGRVSVELAESTGKPPVVRDPLRATQEAAKAFAWNPDTKRSRAEVPLADRPLLLDFNYGGDAGYTARAEVSGSILPTVAEIIARHQQAQSAQDAIVQSYLADARMEQHFRPSPTDAGYDVVTENRFYFDSSGAEWEELSFTLNGSKWGPKRPPIPLLQPEKVLSLPLDLRLNKDYTYRLGGEERVQNRDCYAVRFDPLDDTRSLYRGTVWIDKETYHKVKVQAVQNHLSPPVVSNEEIQTFSPQGSTAGRALWLFSHLKGRQIMLVAGRNLLVEREVAFSNFRINAPDFEALRAASRATDHVMYRDTDQGLRYFVKKEGQRVVQDRPTTKAKALAVGTIIDPSYDYPLPMLGLNYLDFEFLGRKDSQLAVLYAGILALVNVQRPKLIGEHTDASFDLFAIAVASNDKVYDGAGERERDRLKGRPFSLGLNLGHQLTDFQKLTLSYQFRYDAFGLDDATTPGFRLPESTATHGFGLAYEWRRAGYSLTSSGYAYRRGSWSAWGDGTTDFDPDTRNYEKYAASLSKDFFFQAVHKIHLNAAYFGGRHLDRFSTYQFGLFDENRMHGVPSSGVRFSELAMVRAQYSFNLFDQYRLDLFLDQALGRAPERAKDWQNITGTGISVNLRGPWHTMIRADLGKSFLPDLYAGSGTFTAQIMVLKPL
ncbi:MAG TPA: sigma-E factor regulatory protein RseB domain-containing protein [Vicinamibacteria bacterium]|nr:sigma-E factor regulatory protein RseB domain-containing protein [Vicinamibacteria bacterium]